MYKIVIMGDGGVGKTAINHVYVDGKFCLTKVTIGVDFRVHREKIGEKIIKLQIWDFGGESRFRHLLPNYLIGTSGALLVFDITRMKTFENLIEWLNFVYSNPTAKEIPIILVGNKIDLKKNRVISYKEGLELAKEKGFHYIETSAKNNINVGEAFKLLCSLIIEKGEMITLTPEQKQELKKDSLFNDCLRKFQKKEFSRLVELLELVKENDFLLEKSNQSIKSLRIIQLLESSLNKNPFKEKALETNYYLYKHLSVYYHKLGDITTSDDYRFKSIEVLLSFSKESKFSKIAMYLTKWFWEKLTDLIDIEDWYKIFSQKTELYKLCMMEGDQLFRIALQVYLALQSGDGPLLDECENRLNNIQELFPEEENLFKLALNAIDKIRSNLRVGRIVKYNFTPKPLIAKTPAFIKILVENNFDKISSFSIEFISTGFEFNQHMQKIEIFPKKQANVELLLGNVTANDSKKLSAQIRLYDETMNLLEDILLKELNIELITKIDDITIVPDDKEGINIFFSYSTKDNNYLEIPKIKQKLEESPKIGKIYFWERSSRQDIVEYMEKTLKICKVCVLFCTINALESKSVKQEWHAALQRSKKGLIKIVPVYEIEEHIPALLLPLINVKFKKNNFEEFIQKLTNEILRKS